MNGSYRLFFPFSNSLIRAKNRIVKNGMANIGRSIPTEITGLLQEMISNIPVGRNRIGPFDQFEFQPKFPKSLAGKHFMNFILSSILNNRLANFYNFIIRN